MKERERNSFQELEQNIMMEYGTPPSEIQNNISHNVGFFRFLGDMVELYFPRVFHLLISMAGGNPHKVNHSKFKNRPPNTI